MEYRVLEAAATTVVERKRLVDELNRNLRVGEIVRVGAPYLPS